MVDTGHEPAPDTDASAHCILMEKSLPATRPKATGISPSKCYQTRPESEKAFLWRAGAGYLPQASNGLSPQA
jgi:hypothetical protein